MDLVMLLAQLLSTCAPGADHALTRAIIAQESSGRWYAIHDNTTHQAHYPATHAMAARQATALLALGHPLDLGLMQVSSAWLGDYGLTAPQLLDPCTNITTGTAMYQWGVRRCQEAHPAQETPHCALSYYNRGHPTRGAAYAQQVLRRLARRRPVGAVAPPAPPSLFFRPLPRPAPPAAGLFWRRLVATEDTP